MFDVNGISFDDDDLAGAAGEIYFRLSQEQKERLMQFISQKWPDEYSAGIDLMRDEGRLELSISLITDCVSEDDSQQFINDLLEFKDY